MKAIPHESWAHWYDYVYTKTYGKIYQQLNEAHLQLIEALLKNGASILDIGAGTGRLCIPLVERNYRVTAIERCPAMMEVLQNKLQEKSKNIKTVMADMSTFRADANHLALAVFTVLTYTTDFEQMQRNLKNIATHLLPGGYFLFDLPSTHFFEEEDLIDMRTQQLKRKVTMHKLGNDLFRYRDEGSGTYQKQSFSYTDEFTIRYWRIEELEDMLKENGLERVDIDLNHLNFSGADYYLFEKNH